MCGIAGIFFFDKRPRNAGSIRAMTAAMRHRGPDDEGYALFLHKAAEPLIFAGDDTPSNILECSLHHMPQKRLPSHLTTDVQAVLGHRRLAIIDTSAAGHQPMCTEDRRYWLAYNGEVYNYRELRRDLEREGDTFFSDTDTEVVLKAYRRWGDRCLERFNGMWAFAIWDTKRRQLFCARDRIGIKPFYYYHDQRHFIFASDIKTLTASGLFDVEPDWEGVFHSMSFHCAPRPMTCYHNVRSLEQAHWMRIDTDGKTSMMRFWRIPVGQPDNSKNEAYWTARVKETLETAVRRRLVADVPVGTFMSGGVDSTTVSALAAQSHPGIKAFTLGYHDAHPDYDEVPQAVATASRWPMNHIVERVTSESVLPHMHDMMRCYEEPFHSLSPNYMISELVARHGIRVVLSGLGGDELFGGYGRDRWACLWSRFKSFSFLMNKITTRSPLHAKFKDVISKKNVLDVYLAAFATFSDSMKLRLFDRHNADRWNSYKALRDYYYTENIDENDIIDTFCYLDLINYIGNHHVYRTDQFTMRFSLEGRLPFLDHEMVELSFRIPSKYKVKDRVRKYILRKTAEDIIDHSCLTMKKKGFSLPVAKWMCNSLKPFVQEKIAALKKRQIFNTKTIDTIQADFYRGKSTYAHLWYLVSMECWLDGFSKSSLPNQ